MKRLASYSQYFLRNPSLVKELIGHSTIKKSDVVIDIGAGSGIISAALAPRCKTVISVEVEPRMITKLYENLAHHSNSRIYEGSFLTMPLPETPYKIFANIPFHLSSPIVRRLVEAPNSPDAIYLIVQKQFANKLLPSSDRFTGQLGMMIGPLYDARVRKRLQKTDYWPHPNVDTVFLEMLRRSDPLIAYDKMPAYRRFIEECFSDPKKFARMPQKAIGLPIGIKPSQMQLHQWVALFEKQTRYR